MVAFRVRRIVLFGAVLALTHFSAAPLAQSVQVARPVDPAGDSRDWTDDIPAHLTVVDGQVTLERDGKLEPAEANLALLSGDRLRTRTGRVEILFADGSTLALDEDTELDLLSDSLVRLLDGRVRVAIPRTTADLEYRVDAPAASVWIRGAGEYRIQTGADRRGDPNVDLTVLRGSAELVNDFGRTLVRAGRHAVATATTEPSLPYAVNSAAFDEFDEWIEDQRDARVGTVSAAYLPEEVRYYSGAFDNYGSWSYDALYGQVWYPRVDTGWRPYSQGRWSFTAHFGWAWVGIDRWSWPTHHYGRWGFSSSNRWYWIPDRRWAPAWVSWGGAPGYVSWCPLGFDGRPVVGFRSINARYNDPWVAWTTLPARQFTHNVWVNQHVVVPNAIPPAARTAFAERNVAPVPTGYAVPRRELAPLRSPTQSRGAVPRNQPAQSGPFDAARSNRSTGTAATTRGPVSSTIIGSPARPDESRAVPSRGPRPSSNAAEVPRVSVPQVNVPRGNAEPNRPAPDLNRPTPSRATPRQDHPPVAPPTGPPANDNSRSMRARPTEPDRYVPPPAVSQPSRGRGQQSADRYAPPPSAPEPSRSRGQAVERHAPPPPPQQSAPAPSRSRTVAPPPSAPPPSRGGGGGGDTGKGRSRGGGGR